MDDDSLPDGTPLWAEYLALGATAAKNERGIGRSPEGRDRRSLCTFRYSRCRAGCGTDGNAKAEGPSCRFQRHHDRWDYTGNSSNFSHQKHCAFRGSFSPCSESLEGIDGRERGLFCLRQPQMLHLIPPLLDHLVLINPNIALPCQHVHMRPRLPIRMRLASVGIPKRDVHTRKLLILQ